MAINSNSVATLPFYGPAAQRVTQPDVKGFGLTTPAARIARTNATSFKQAVARARPSTGAFGTDQAGAEVLEAEAEGDWGFVEDMVTSGNGETDPNEVVQELGDAPEKGSDSTQLTGLAQQLARGQMSGQGNGDIQKQLQIMFGTAVVYTPRQIMEAAAALEDGGPPVLDGEVTGTEEQGQTASALPATIRNTSGSRSRQQGPLVPVGPVGLAVTDLSAGDEAGVASSLAPGVEAQLREEFKAWLPADAPRVAGLMKIFKSADFEALPAYAQASMHAHGAAVVNAFTETTAEGTVRLIPVREGAENRQTLAHEWFHANLSPEAKSALQSREVNGEDLSEGVVRYLTAQYMGNSWQAPPTQAETIAGRIAEAMGAEAFNRALFGGDDSPRALDALRQQASTFSELTVYPETAPKSVEAMTSSPDPYAHVRQGDVQHVNSELYTYGDPRGEIFGTQVEPVSNDEIDQIEGLKQVLAAKEYPAAVITAIERSLYAQPAEQRSSTMSALLGMTDSQHALIVAGMEVIAPDSTGAAARALASMVANMAALPEPEQSQVFDIHGILETKTYQVNSPFITGATKAWVMSDVALMSPGQRAQFETNIRSLDAAESTRLGSYVGNYGGQVQARLVGSLIWMGQPYRTTAGDIVVRLGQIENDDQVNARWNEVAAPLTPDQRTELPESLRRLLHIFDRTGVPEHLRNYAPVARRYSPLDLATSPILARAVQAMHARNGTDAAAQAVVNLIRRRVGQAIARGEDPSTKPIELRVLIGTGFNVAEGLPETDGPPGAGLLGHDLLQLNQGEVRIPIHNSAGEVEIRNVRLKVDVHYVVDKLNKPVQEAVNASLGFDAEIHTFNEPRNADTVNAEANALLDAVNPDIVLFTEHPGRNKDGDYDNMRRVSVAEFNAPVDEILVEANKRANIVTIAVGDGGNEAGMGDVNVHMMRDVLGLSGYIAGPPYTGTDIFAAEGVQYPVTATVSNWGAEAIGATILDKLGRLGSMHQALQVRDAIYAAGNAGAVDGVLRSKPGTPDETGLEAGVDGLSVPAHVGQYYRLMAALLAPKISELLPPDEEFRAPNIPSIDLILFDSSNGGLIAANTIARIIREQTGQPVRRVVFVDHGMAPYGERGKDEIATLTNNALRTAENVADAAIPYAFVGMVCNTACTSGQNKYAESIVMPVSDLIEVTARAMINNGDSHPVVLATKATTDETHAYAIKIEELTGGTRVATAIEGGGTRNEIRGLGRTLIVTEIGAGATSEGAGNDWASIVNRMEHLDPDKDVSDAVDAHIRRIVKNIPENATSVWLNCTHYPELKSRIEAALKVSHPGKNIPVIDPMPYQAERLMRMMRDKGVLPLQEESSAGMSTAQRLGPEYTGPEYTPPPVVVTTALPSDAQRVNDRRLTEQEVYEAARVFMGRPDVRMIRLERFGEEADIDNIVPAFTGPGVISWREALNVAQAVNTLQTNSEAEASRNGLPNGDAVQRAVYDALLRKAIPPEDLEAANIKPPAPATPPATPAQGTPPVQGVKAVVIAGNGALAYSSPAATSPPAGLFRRPDSISLTGAAHTNTRGRVWVEVTGTEISGNELTAWVDVRDIGHLSISGPAGIELHAAVSSSEAADILAADAQLTPTGRVQSSNGEVWIEVEVTEANQAGEMTRTGWIGCAWIGQRSAPPTDESGTSQV